MVKKRFEQRLNSLSSELWIKIAQIDELKGQWVAGTQLSSQVLGRLKRSILITSTGASTRIEGARLSDEDVEKLMRGLDIQKFNDRDKQEVKGYFELLENIFNSWKSINFSESTIKHFHKELLNYVEKDKIHRGEYKKNENKVHMIDKAGKSVGVLFDTTQAFLTPKEMQELVEWTKEAFLEKKNHPLLIIANFIVEFLQIHPFQDGNGRLSRILTNLLLLKAGYLYMPYASHEKLIEDNKPDYYMALRKSQKTFKTSHETITSWLGFFLEILLQQSKTAIELLSQENVEKFLSVKQLAVWQYLQTVDEATPKEIVKKTKIVRPTVNQVLDKLIRLKKIERFGLGRSTRYRKL
ncbi:MAG: Adenosine monophosphate-protein transferase SoFic [Candidatus Anoxychlamydiales bacterium]|nr:Adenosine monophosphate-protein transferase SoFic [Candidatus Anoxychlamydiales bacterium]